MNAVSTSCAFNQNFVATLQGSGTIVTPLCPAEITNTTCENPSNPNPGIEKYTYTVNIDLASNNCADFIFSYNECCRDAGILNLQNPTTHNQYLEARLDNSAGNCANNSVVFTETVVPFVFTNNAASLRLGAYDPDGDSLSFSFVNALENPAPGGNLSYMPDYTAALPMTSSPNIDIDSVTGTISVTPRTLQNSVVTVRVEEWRNGTMVGVVLRDLQIISTGYMNSIPALSTSAPQNLTSGTLAGDTIEVCAGDSITWDFSATDADFDNLVMTSNITSVLNGAEFSQSGFGPVVTGYFGWRPGFSDVGINSYVLTVRDDACPMYNVAAFTYHIRVLEAANAGPDMYVCGDSVELAGNGGTTWTWTAVLPGTTANMSCTNCQNPKTLPAGSIDYIVTTDYSGTCKSVDTVTVNVVATKSTVTSNDTTVCAGGGARLRMTPTPVTANATYSWTPAATVAYPTDSNTIANPTTTTKYYCSVTDSFCTWTDSITVTVSGSGPVPTVTADETNLCAGDSAQITATISWTPTCDTNTVISCGGGSATFTVGTEDGQNDTISPFWLNVGTNDAARRQYIFTAAELRTQGLTGGSLISGIQMNFAVTPSGTVDGLSINMGCTGSANFAAGTGNTPGIAFIGGLTEVMANVQNSVAGGWEDFTFDYPYLWDGTSNIVIEFCTDNFNGAGNPAEAYFTNTTDQMTNSAMSDAVGGCSLANGESTSKRPMMRFSHCQTNPTGASFAWSPAGDLDDSTVPNPKAGPTSDVVLRLTASDPAVGGCPTETDIAINVSPAFTLTTTLAADTVCPEYVSSITTSPSAGGSFTYSWAPSSQVVTDNGTLATVAPTSTQDYYVTASKGACTVSDTVELATYAAGPSVTLSRARDTICVGDTTQLDASGATNYNWSPPTDLDNSSISNPIATLTSSQLFVVGCDNGGCSTYESIQVCVDQGCVLPIPFLTLGAQLIDGKVELDWHVDPSQRPREFQVQRSVDGNDFSVIADIANPDYKSGDFQSTDASPFEGNNLYRVLMTNEHGELFTSNAVEVFVEQSGFNWTVYPNPTTGGDLKITVNDHMERTAKIILYDSMGKKVVKASMDTAIGKSTHDLHLPRLQAGHYFVSIQLGNSNSVKSLIVLP